MDGVAYAEFLTGKATLTRPSGIVMPGVAVHPSRFGFQTELILWALRKGRAALFTATGTGKAGMAIEFARLTGERSLIFTPLGVTGQFVDEGRRLGVDVTIVRSQADVIGQISVTNYERLHLFDMSQFGCVVIDESSCLKDHESKTRAALTEACRDIPFRLACTATPSPNDVAELANHAEFLGLMSRTEMLATWFVHDESGWRLRGHAREPFYRWLASWAMTMKRPSDLGYPDDGYELPPLEIHPVIVQTDWVRPGQLFATSLKGITDRAQVRKATLADRVRAVVDLVNQSHGVLSSTGSGDKLAVCGNQNTPSDAEPNTKLTQPSANGEKHKGGRQKKTSNTCALTTKTTERTISASRQPSAQPSLMSSEPSASSNGTTTTSGIANGSKQRRESTPSSILASGEPTTSNAPTELKLPSTTDSWQSNPVDARSAVSQQNRPVNDSTSTTTTRPEQSEGYSASDVILDSACSETAPIASESRWTTSPDKLEPWILWVGLNDEQDALAAAFGDRAISIYGTLSSDEKERRMAAWIAGDRPILITKPSIAGFGMNFQFCAHMIFVGLNDSFEIYHQAVRRCWRYGQVRPVHAYVVLSEPEEAIYANVKRKEREFEEMTDELIRHVANFEQAELGHVAQPSETDHARPMTLPRWLQGAVA